MKERLKLVESFDELRAGMIVVLKDCAIPGCGGRHRGILLKPNKSPSTFYRGRQTTSAGWITAPSPACIESIFANYAVGTEAVAERRVYRVLDGLEDTQQTTERTPRKRTARV